MQNNKQILKLICGAGNENIDEIEKLSYIYASVGFNMIDTTAKIEAVKAVKNGIKKAGKINNVKICVSIGLKDDIHLSKAFINLNKCLKCGDCINICDRNAIEKFIIDEKNCIGCLKCVKICKYSAIEKKAGKNCQIDKNLLKEKIDCIEIHCSSYDENAIVKYFDEITSIYEGQLSICLNRSKLGDERIISLLKQIIVKIPNLILQTDGKPMTGGVNDFKSSLQAIAFAEIIRNEGIRNKIILSGGTNAKTAEFAKICGIEIDGIAFGSFARKIVNEFIKQNDFWENKKLRISAINKAELLANSISI